MSEELKVIKDNYFVKVTKDTRYKTHVTYKKGNIIKTFLGSILSLFMLITVMGSFYTVEEGHVYIVKRLGEAVRAEEPGLRFKLPIIEETFSMEVRTRKYQQKMSVSTMGKTINEKTGKVKKTLQMPSTVIISANWNIPKEYALEIYKKYGGLTQFEDRILDPRVLNATKEIFPKFSIEEIVGNRSLVTSGIITSLTTGLEGTSVSMTDINIEDIDFPHNIKKAVEAKQIARQNFEKEQDILNKQNLVAQQRVNTSKAKAESIRLEADAEAHSTRVRGEADAHAIKVKARALSKNPALVELTKAERWNGELPTHMFGAEQQTLFRIK